MSILEQLVRIFAPHTCVGCGVEVDALLCAACADGLPAVPERCYRCWAASRGGLVCERCTDRSALHRVLACTPYAGAAKALVRRMKFERAQAGLHEAAALMAPLLTALPNDVLLTHVPTASSRVRARGYDHARMLARDLGRLSGCPRQTVLARLGQTRQVGAGPAERLRQIGGAFRPVRADAIRGRHIVLIDDVLTTGATLETAARTLLRAGAARVSAVVFAQAGPVLSVPAAERPPGRAAAPAPISAAVPHC